MKVTFIVGVELDNVSFDLEELMGEIESGVNVAVEDVTGEEPEDITVEVVGFDRTN